MAALLRSARLLKFSPSGLLQITGTSRKTPPLGRLYSGTGDGKGLGVCPRQVAPGYSPASRRCVWPYAGVRNYTTVPEQRVASNNVSTRGPQSSKQEEELDWVLTKLDSSVKRTGRITRTLLQKIFQNICRRDNPSEDQALLLFRCCGSLLPEVHKDERTELVHHFWDKLAILGLSYDVSHYNALLKVYLHNEFKFSPTEFLAKMEAANVQPNRVTFQRLIAAYCNVGDIEGASTILGFMKSKDLPITEPVFNSLVTGHARAGDMESAEGIPLVMKGVGIEPGPETYVALLNAYAEKGDMEKIRQTLQLAKSAPCYLVDRDLMQVVFSLAKSGHQEHIPEVLGDMQHRRGYVADAANLCLSLITLGQDDTAFTVLKTLRPSISLDGANLDVGNFFIRHCVIMGTPAVKLAGYCKEMQDSNLHSTPLQFSVLCALQNNKPDTAVQLMKIMKEEGLPVRPHFFWPLLTHHRQDKNTAGVLEVVKWMQELEVTADVDTLVKYVLPTFPNAKDGHAALKEVGFLKDSLEESDWAKEVWAKSVCFIADQGKLQDLYTLLSSPSFPLDLRYFRHSRDSLITSFIKSDDVESMIKITALLYKEERFSPAGADTVSYFLYNLLKKMSADQVKTQDDKLRQYFNQLKTMDVTITLNIFRGIRNLLQSYNIHSLITCVRELTESADDISANEAVAVKVLLLERELAELSSAGKPRSSVLIQLITSLTAHSSAQNLDRALELKHQHEDHMVTSGYLKIMLLCIHCGNVEEALNLKRELSCKDVTLDYKDYLHLVLLLCKVGRVEEAVDMLKEIKVKEVPVDNDTQRKTFQMLNNLPPDVTTIKSIQDTIFRLGLTKPTRNLCSPLINAYLKNNDLQGALEACMEAHKEYRCLPRCHDIIVGLVNQGNTALLQQAMDYLSETQGEMMMLYDLLFAFMDTGHYSEAQKVIETPGLRARSGRLHWFATKCIAGNQMEALEKLVHMTRNLFECDRDEMYSYLLQLCKATNNWRKAESVWMAMQEENVIPRERTMLLLAEILIPNGKEVPKVWYDEAAGAEKNTERIPRAEENAGAEKVTEWIPLAEKVTERIPPAEKNAGAEKAILAFQHSIFDLCKKGLVKEAYAMLKNAGKEGMDLGRQPYDFVIKALLAEGNLEEALVLKDLATSRLPGFCLNSTASSRLIITYLKRDQLKDALAAFKTMRLTKHVPNRISLYRLLNAMSSHGDLQGIQEVESLMQSHPIPSMHLVNNRALALIKNGDLEGAIESLEAVFTQGGENADANMSHVFKIVIEDKNEEALDKLSAMAVRLTTHFQSSRSACDLFLQLLEAGRIEDCKSLLACCNVVAERTDILNEYIRRKSWKGSVKASIIKTLHDIIPDFTEKETIYNLMMECYYMDGCLASAKSLYEQMQQEGVAATELSLKSLASLYKKAGETAPFTEPPETFTFYADKLEEKL